MRNAEVIRQWKILKRIEKSRYVTASDLAEEHEKRAALSLSRPPDKK